MDETTSSIIDRITIRSDKPMRLINGEYSSVFYDCIQLTPNDLARLAAESVGELSESTFDLAIGIAYSGILFAAAVAGGKQVAILDHEGAIQGPSIEGKKVILVDDVVHTGRRITLGIEAVNRNGGQLVGIACIVYRQGDLRSPLSVPVWSAVQLNG
jgi:orotate phosphoribosyltransferase